jgi:hypothetical protein
VIGKPSVVELRLIDLRFDRAGTELPAPSHAERNQAVVGPALPVPGEALDWRLIRRLGVGQALCPAAGVAGTDADLGKRTNIGLGMRRAARVVKPGMHEGHSGIDRFRRREPRALKDIVRAHLLAEARHRREIAFLRLVARKAAEQRVPHVPMSLDEAGHHDHAGGVDLFAAPDHVLADGDDFAIAHVYGAARDIPECAVHRHHVSIGDGELAARRES